jgi:5'-3' exonuclease
MLWINEIYRDAQLAFLSLTGAVDLVITEDSDALVYGCRRVLFKLDKDGSGDEIKRRSLGANQGEIVWIIYRIVYAVNIAKQLTLTSNRLFDCNHQAYLS